MFSSSQDLFSTLFLCARLLTPLAEPVPEGVLCLCARNAFLYLFRTLCLGQGDLQHALQAHSVMRRVAPKSLRKHETKDHNHSLSAQIHQASHDGSVMVRKD